MKGRSFYTEPADHYNCAVGAYTHSIPLPAERGSQLEDTVKFMVLKEYLRMEEVPGIPTLEKTPAYISYAPVDEASFQHDLVLIAAKPSAAMLIYETAVRSGAGATLTNALGRPACAVVPLTAKTGFATLSLGCMGNRTFTGLPDEELYVCIPSAHWPKMVSKLTEIGRPIPKCSSTTGITRRNSRRRKQSLCPTLYRDGMPAARSYRTSRPVPSLPTPSGPAL